MRATLDLTDRGIPHSTVDHGTIVEQGTYQELTERKGPFSVLMQEFGGQSAAQAEERAEQEEEAISEAGEEADKSQKAKAVKKSIARAGAGSGKLEGRLIQQEKRTTGTIAFAVYRQYFSAARGWITLPLVLGSAVIMQGAQVLAGLWLVFWENDDFNQPLGFYVSGRACWSMLHHAESPVCFNRWACTPGSGKSNQLQQTAMQAR